MIAMIDVETHKILRVVSHKSGSPYETSFTRIVDDQGLPKNAVTDLPAIGTAGFLSVFWSHSGSSYLWSSCHWTHP